MVTAVHNFDKAYTEAILRGVNTKDFAALEKLVKDIVPPYENQTKMKMAVLYAKNGQRDKAVDIWRTLSTMEKDPGVRALVDFNWANVLLDEKKHDEVLSLVSKDHPREFRSIFLELKGDALLRKNDRKAAKGAYQAALAQMGDGVTPFCWAGKHWTDSPVIS